jgi:hypothetical protein
MNLQLHNRIRAIAAITQASLPLFPLILGGCSNEAGTRLSREPLRTQVFVADYQKLADCTFGRLYASSSDIGANKTDLKKTDLISSGMVRIILDNGQSTYWTLTFSRESTISTKVVLVPSVWGPLTAGIEHIFPEVEACAETARGPGSSRR